MAAIARMAGSYRSSPIARMAGSYRSSPIARMAGSYRSSPVARMAGSNRYNPRIVRRGTWLGRSTRFRDENVAGLFA